MRGVGCRAYRRRELALEHPANALCSLVETVLARDEVLLAAHQGPLAEDPVVVCRVCILVVLCVRDGRMECERWRGWGESVVRVELFVFCVKRPVSLCDI